MLAGAENCAVPAAWRKGDALRGRIPKPTAVKRLAGNPGKRALNELEPKPVKAAPERADILGPVGRRIFEATIRELEAMGTLARCDGESIAVYCRLYERWLECEKWISEKGSTFPVRNADGNVKGVVAWPQVADARGLAQIVLSYQREFGLTPSARSRVKSDRVEMDDFEIFLKG